jgi:hypothetical protein
VCAQGRDRHGCVRPPLDAVSRFASPAQRHKPSRETLAAFAFTNRALRLSAVFLFLRPTLCIGLRVADGFRQHLAQLGLNLRRFARWCSLPCGHEWYVGMPEGQSKPRVARQRAVVDDPLFSWNEQGAQVLILR